MSRHPKIHIYSLFVYFSIFFADVDCPASHSLPSIDSTSALSTAPALSSLLVICLNFQIIFGHKFPFSLPNGQPFVNVYLLLRLIIIAVLLLVICPLLNPLLHFGIGTHWIAHDLHIIMMVLAKKPLFHFDACILDGQLLFGGRIFNGEPMDVLFRELRVINEDDKC